MSPVNVFLAKYPIITDQIQKPALQVVLHELEKVLNANIEGNIVELGCYIGTTSLFIRRLLDHYKLSGSREFHVYDSFAGLPPKSMQDTSAVGIDFKAGELSASKKQLLQEFHKAALQPPIMHKAWFDDLTDEDMPRNIAYAFLDGDFYGSIISSLRLVWPRLSRGGVVTIDDYQRETLPGVEQAVKDFFQNKSIKLHHEHNIAIIKRA
jgi:O-methyltransferase